MSVYSLDPDQCTKLKLHHHLTWSHRFSHLNYYCVTDWSSVNSISQLSHHTPSCYTKQTCFLLGIDAVMSSYSLTKGEVDVSLSLASFSSLSPLSASAGERDISNNGSKDSPQRTGGGASTSSFSLLFETASSSSR